MSRHQHKRTDKQLRRVLTLSKGKIARRIALARKVLGPVHLTPPKPLTRTEVEQIVEVALARRLRNGIRLVALPQ